MIKTSTHKQQKVHDFLKQHPTGVLSTVSRHGEPWGAAVSFVADEGLNFFFMTRAGTLKYGNIEANPLAAITIVDQAEQTTVQAMGTISRVAAKDTIDVVFKKLAAAKPHGDSQWVPPIIKVHQGDYMVLRLTPSKLQYANYKQTKPAIDASYIEQIIG